MKDLALRRFAASVAVGSLLGGVFLLATGTRIGVGWGLVLVGLALGCIYFETSLSSSPAPVRPRPRGTRERP